MDPTLPPAARSAARKTAGLKTMVDKEGFTGLIAGIRRDEEGTRAKERVFSPRGHENKWDFRDQPPEFWDQFKTDFAPGTHLRVHPILHWTEIDIWLYTKRENIPLIDLYFAKDGKRYRSLGDQDITFPVDSTASTLDDIIAELRETKIAERSGRAMDHESEDAFERLPCGRIPLIMNSAAVSSHQSTLPLKVVIVGHVDHGKSSLIGRLFHDTGSLPEGKADAIRAMCEKRGMPFEYAFLMDALQAERDQGITIDISQIHFKTKTREYVLIDAPGHREFVKNMVTGAAQADAAVLCVDAREGVQENTRRHAYLLHLLGLHQVVVAVNKMDLVDYSEARFQEVSAEVRDYLAHIGIDLKHTLIIPVSARNGDNIVDRTDTMPWYDAETLEESLDSLQPPVAALELPLRFPVQDVYKFDERRIIAGRIESGHLCVGDELLFSPSNKTAKIETIEGWNVKGQAIAARAGQSVGITLDHQIFVERGEVASLTSNPPMLTNVFRGRLFWLGRTPLAAGNRYKMKLGTSEFQVEVEKIERVIDVADLQTADTLVVDRHAIAEVIFRVRRQIWCDPFEQNMHTGRFVLIDEFDIVGGGLVNMDGYADQRPGQTVKSTNIFMVEHRGRRRAPVDHEWP